MRANQAPQSVAGVLRALVTLHALRRLEADMGALLTEGLLTLDTARAIPAEIRCAAPGCSAAACAEILQGVCPRLCAPYPTAGL